MAREWSVIAARLDYYELPVYPDSTRLNDQAVRRLVDVADDHDVFPKELLSDEP